MDEVLTYFVYSTLTECFDFFSLQKKLKSKLDGNAIESQQNNPENLYRFEEDETTPAKTIKTSSSASIDGLSSSVSINIVHQINGGNSQQEQKISTNVTVNQTINSQPEVDQTGQSGVECKKEPNEESANSSNDADNNDLDSDIDNLLNPYGADIPQDIIDELNKFEEIYKSVKDSEGNDSSLNSSSSDAGNSSMFASNMYVDPNQGPGQVRTPPYQRAQSHIPSSMGEGGLAAETLKQMAAQHQQQHPNQEQYGVKSTLDPFSDITGSYGSSRNGYSTAEYQQYLQQQQQRAGSTGPYSSQSSIGYPNKPEMPGYNSALGTNNKQISHYAHNASSQSDTTTPSSLQQLQNQVAHFNQGPHMEITQTQHMQVSDGSHRMQMSQTQHVQLRQPLQNISLTQQQGFSASPQSQSFMGNDQMNMQQHQQQQQQAQQMMHQNKMAGDPRQSHMHQYMNRPPPEYKMQAGGMSSAMTSNNVGPNPLQTIQNMVNQTNTLPNRGYSPVKSEASDTRMPNGMRNVQMSAMQQQMAAGGPMNPVGMSMSQAQLSYSNQAVQRQSSYPGAIGAMGARPQRPSAPTYTSAIMRNQRPPNVNIGPDGLNISQPRSQEWPRGMMPNSRGAAPSTTAGMMQYRSYSSDGTNSAAAAAQMQMQQQHQGQRSLHMESMHMESQQAAMMQNNVHTQQMMMQQQRMHMSQQMGQPSHTAQPTSYNMTSQQQNSYPQTSSAQDDFLNLLDSAPNQSTDFFDVQTSGGGTESNWYDIDDILGNTK